MRKHKAHNTNNRFFGKKCRTLRFSLGLSVNEMSKPALLSNLLLGDVCSAKKAVFFFTITLRTYVCNVEYVCTEESFDD